MIFKNVILKGARPFGHCANSDISILCLFGDLLEKEIHQVRNELYSSKALSPGVFAVHGEVTNLGKLTK